MKQIKDSDQYRELNAKYGSDLVGFISLFTEIATNEKKALSSLSRNGVCRQDQRLWKYSPYIALWHLLFKENSLFFYIAFNKESEQLFIKAVEVAISALKLTDLAWLCEYLVVKNNSILLKDDTSHIVAKGGFIKPENVAGCFAKHLMIWIEKERLQNPEVLGYARSAMTQANYQLIQT